MFWRDHLRRFFSEFPSGLPGLSLLLLRLVLGVGSFTQGVTYLEDPNLTLFGWSLGLMAIAAGLLLLIGFLTPLAALTLALGAVSTALSLLPVGSPTPLNSKLQTILILTMLQAIIGLGPGRCSIDARIFGRRQIIIPVSLPPEER